MNMSRGALGRSAPNCDSRIVEVKSKLDAEYRRFMLSGERLMTFTEFHQLLEDLHRLKDVPFTVWFTDNEGDLLPINNDDNFTRAVRTTKRLLRLTVLKSGEALQALTQKKSAVGSGLLSGTGLYGTKSRRGNHVNQPIIGFPEDFRRVSAIIDIDIVPETCRRVKLMKNGASDKPLGFYIRDGASIRVTPQGLEKVNGVFISRLAPGGLAESTGLLAVNDEILEVNGIEVFGKTLDQVTDMMVANSNNLIITVKPVNQHNNIVPRRGTARPGKPRLPNQRSHDGEFPAPGTWEVPRRPGSSEGRSTPKVSAKILPSGVQVLEL